MHSHPCFICVSSVAEFDDLDIQEVLGNEHDVLQIQRPAQNHFQRQGGHEDPDRTRSAQRGRDGDGTLGRGIHEMGSARMGKDAKTSVLNNFNQMWDAPNVFITDGSFMTSAACVNPSLTYMAFTARAADYAVSELKKGNL